ncbi:hypothetical protein niasHS_008935 [Heterodera schachtii]|uniref:Uncharacterized protein n=1 Tax=Heterodera schachtii TaxID=97005 RepID=A0ABD2J4U5_HETSC
MPNLNVIREDDAVNDFLVFLHYDQKLGHHIAKAYNETVFCPAKKQIRKEMVNQILQLTFSLAIRIAFSVIKYSQNVSYDEKRQLLAFPLSTGEHIIARLSELIELIGEQHRTVRNDHIGRQIDVVKTIQNIASMEPIQFYERKFTLYWHDWVNFDLFLSMAIRLSAQIERNDHLNVLLSASPNNHSDYFFFGYKMQITNGNLVEMNSPTWLVPYYVYWGNNKDPQMVRLFDHERSKKPLEEALVQREAKEHNMEQLMEELKHLQIEEEIGENKNKEKVEEIGEKGDKKGKGKKEEKECKDDKKGKGKKEEKEDKKGKGKKEEKEGKEDKKEKGKKEEKEDKKGKGKNEEKEDKKGKGKKEEKEDKKGKGKKRV